MPVGFCAVTEDAGRSALKPGPPDLARCCTELRRLGGISGVYILTMHQRTIMPVWLPVCFTLTSRFPLSQLFGHLPYRPGGIHSALGPVNCGQPTPPSPPLLPALLGAGADLFSRPRGPAALAPDRTEINTRAARGRQNSAATRSDAGRRPVAQTSRGRAQRRRGDAAGT